MSDSEELVITGGPEGAGEPGGAEPRLAAVRCGQCGFTDFPPQAYGCRQCGAHGSDLARVDIAAVGTVTARAEVHPQGGPETRGAADPAPFTVASVHLDAGPATRVIMRAGESPVIGDRVTGVLADGGLRFAVSPGRAAAPEKPEKKDA